MAIETFDGGLLLAAGQVNTVTAACTAQGIRGAVGIDANTTRLELVEAVGQGEVMLAARAVGGVNAAAAVWVDATHVDIVSAVAGPVWFAVKRLVRGPVPAVAPGLLVQPNGIASSLAVGDPTVALAGLVMPDGIASLLAVGAPIVALGTPLVQWPAVTVEQIDACFPGFVQPLPPIVAGAVIDVTADTLVATATANPGRQLRLTASSATTRTLSNATDVELLIPDGVTLQGLIFGADCLRVRVVGEGPTSRVEAVRANAGSSHCTAHSLLLPSSPFLTAFGAALDSDGPYGVVSCILGAGNDGGFSCGFVSGAGNILFAGCNLGALPNAGVDDYAIRHTCDHVVYVDCFAESQGGQPVLRRSDGNGWAMFRVTTFNAADNECFKDLGAGLAEIVADACVHDSESYIGGTGVRIGGADGAMTSNSWRITNHVYRSPGANVDDALLAGLEALGPAPPDDWQYRLGTPQYLVWDGVSHPGWPARVGLLSGVPMNPSDPYAL